MTDCAEDQVMAFLFNQEGITLRNLKLFLGEQPMISKDDICREMHSAFMQERMGTAKVSRTFEDLRPTVNVEEFLASL